jgi:hypothetical protein
MSKLREATLEDLPEILEGLKQYHKEGEFQYVRRDYLKRCIEAGELWRTDGAMGVFHQLKHSSRQGNYKTSKGDWTVNQLMSFNRKNALAITSFWRQAMKKIGTGTIIGTIHKYNKRSLDYHLSLGFGIVGEITWANGTIPGYVVAYECDPPSIEKFLV